MNELRFALRRLRQSPGFTLIAVLTLALGIGANTAIFSVVNGVLLRPLPYAKPAELVTLKSQQSSPELADLVAQAKSFVSIGGVGVQAADYAGATEPIQLELGLVGGDFFHVLGTRAALGRTLTAEDDRFGGPQIVVLTNELWQRQFGGDPSVLGRSITLAGQSYSVAGVLPTDFRSPRGALDAFVPVHVFYPLAAKSRGAHLLRVYARLRSGLTTAQAQSELRVIDQHLARANPDEDKNRQTTLVPLHEQMVGDIRPALLVLFGAVGLVLLIACANFANLLLARTATRRQELTVRAALGASRAQLIRQVLLDSVLLALLGGAAGLLLGSWGIDALLALRPDDLPRVENVHLDGFVLGFTFVLALATGVLFGVLPAWEATRLQISSVLSAGGRSVTTGRSAFRSFLVIAELALALALLIGAGLLGQAFWRLTSVAPGFHVDHILTMRVELPEARYHAVAPQTRFREQVLENMNSLPGVQAAMISELPLGGNAISHNFLIEGRSRVAKGDEPELFNRSVAGDYFQVLGIPLLRGRALDRNDRAGIPAVGVVNEAMAKTYFPNANPIGVRMRWARDEGVDWITIVGVVGNVRHFGLAAAEEPAIYTPDAQSGQEWKRWSELVVKIAGSSSPDLVRQLKESIWKADPLIPVTSVRPMSEVLAVSLAEQRFNSLLLAIFAGVALLLAGVGLYGVLAFLVTQRTREIGIRVALGAQARDVMRLVLRQGMTLSGIGVVAGICLSLAATRVLAGLLYGISPTDPVTFIALAALLVFVALIACVVPARRAMRVDPIIALRHE